MNNLIIDVKTKDANRLIKRLEKLATTFTVEHGGMYRQDPHYSQIHLTTTKTVDETEDWLYNSKANFDYVGVVERKV